MKIIFHRRFEKQIKKLPRPVIKAYKERRDLFLADLSDPILHNHSVDAVYPGCRSFNVTGDYRVVFQEIAVDTVIFLYIGTHSELYG